MFSYQNISTVIIKNAIFFLFTWKQQRHEQLKFKNDHFHLLYKTNNKPRLLEGNLIDKTIQYKRSLLFFLSSFFLRGGKSS